MNREAKIKRVKKIIISTIAGLMASTSAFLTSLSLNLHEKQYDDEISYEEVHEQSVSNEYEHLERLRKAKLPTTTQNFKGVSYEVADEERILRLSELFAETIEDYFKSCGASYWTSDVACQFWPEDIAYMVTAIAYKESSYRTNVINDLGCSGLTCINKEDLLKTLGEQWLVPRIWGNNVPKVNCNPDEVDIFNGTTCIEYTYYNIGYNLANRFKKDKYFTDTDGERRCIWNVLEYSEEMQNRLIIASHLYGITNVIDSIFERNYDKDGNLIPLSHYINSPYVEGVLDKMVELELKYGNNLNY